MISYVEYSVKKQTIKGFDCFIKSEIDINKLKILVMKKLFITCLALTAFVFPLLSQIDHDFNPNDREPVVTANIAKDQVPAAILKAVNTQFAKDNPLTWSKFPYALKEYGWVYDVGASNLNLDHFQVTMRTSTGSQLEAIYTTNGDLIETREMSINVPIPSGVMADLQKSQYKDWTVVGNKEIIRFYHDHDNNSVEQHFRLTVEKDKVRRSISFNFQEKATK